MPTPTRRTPVTPQRLAGLAVERALPLLDAARAAGTAVRLGVDGAVDTETAAVADLVAARALELGVPAVRIDASDFLHRRSVRLEWGAADVDNAYERWVDTGALRREVLDPLVDPERLTWLPRLREATADRSAREQTRRATPGTLAVLAGPYLLRADLAGALDAVVHLDLAPATLGRRFPGPDDPRGPAWLRYLQECDPVARADLVVRHDHPDRPAVLV